MLTRCASITDEETAPVREYYAGTTGVTAIDGDQNKDRVAEAIRRELQPADAEG